jgi:hypothetical protein
LKRSNARFLEVGGPSVGGFPVKSGKLNVFDTHLADGAKRSANVFGELISKGVELY